MPIALVVGSVLALAGCEKERKKAGGSAAPLVEEDLSSSANVYRFVTVEQAVLDARRAAAEERWAAAASASAALLKEQPNHAEALKINQEAKLEAPNQARYNEMMKAAARNDVGDTARAFKTIAENSLYKARARPEYERVRNPWLDAQDREVRTHMRAGRCDDGRRGARLAMDLFPEMRPRMEDAVSTPCRQVARRDRDRDRDRDRGRDRDRDDKTSELASISSAAIATAPPPPPPAAAPSRKPKTKGYLASAGASLEAELGVIAAHELEQLRVSGSRKPSLAPNVKAMLSKNGAKSASFSMKICNSEAGVPIWVEMVRGSSSSQADEWMKAQVQKWRFRPFVKGGTAQTVCSAVQIAYTLD